MAAKRYLLGTFLAGLFGTSAAFAQPGPGAPAPYLNSPGTGLPPGATPAGGGMGYQGGATGYPQATPPGATTLLTAPPGFSNQPLPPGSVQSPWCGGVPAGAGCCGPVGANGPVTYELYARTGPSFVIGGSRAFSGALGFGWNVAGGGRTLLLNQAGDAAWALDLGLGFTHNQGDQNRVLDIFTPQAKNAQGQLNGPDQLNSFRVRGLYRTSFNYAIGRDWWLNGPAYTGSECHWNSRFGVDLGGRWGTSHVDLIPVGNPAQYLRLSGIFNSVVLGAHWTCEVPMGATILFAGIRGEIGYTYSNIIPPQDGNLQDISVLLTLGVRF